MNSSLRLKYSDRLRYPVNSPTDFGRLGLYGNDSLRKCRGIEACHLKDKSLLRQKASLDVGLYPDFFSQDRLENNFSFSEFNLRHPFGQNFLFVSLIP